MTFAYTTNEQEEIDTALANNAFSATRALRKIFQGGLAAFLEPDRFSRFVTWWTDRQLHGGVRPTGRAGYALRSADMHGLAPSLFDPQHYYLSAEDLPCADHHLVREFSRKLIAQSASRHFEGDVATAIEIVTARFGYNGDPRKAQLDHHVEALCDIAGLDTRLFQAALLGDFTTCADLVSRREMEAPVRAELVRILARQRIIWDAADVHRIAGRGSKASEHYVAWFLRPLVRTRSANEYLRILQSLGITAKRLKAAERRAWRAGLKTVSVSGRPGPVLKSVKPAARALELALTDDQQQSILETRASVHAQTMDMTAKVEAVLEADDRNEQETIYQFKNAGLSEIATLFIVAYRFAEDEAAMLKIIADPDDDTALWNIHPSAYPTEIDPAFAARARRLVAVYRPAVLRDCAASKYDKDRIDLAEKSEEDAQKFLKHIGRQANAIAATDIASDDAIVARICDLSHYVRDRAMMT